MKENDFLRRYYLLNKIDFNSERKKMSVIVKMKREEQDENLNMDLEDDEDEAIYVLTKGSDDVIVKDLDVEKSPDLPSVEKYIKILSKQGLRLLMVAYKKITYKEYLKWKKKY